MADSAKPTGKALDWPIIIRLLGYVKPYRSYFFLALFFTILLAVLGPLRPILIQVTLDQDVAQRDLVGLQEMILIIFGLLAVESFIMYGNTYLTNWLGQSIIRDIRNKVFQHIIKLQLKYFDRTPIGMLQTRTINDVETLNDVFSSGLVRILGDMLQIFAILAAMFYINWVLALSVLATVPLLLIATYIFKNKVKVAFQGVRKSVSEMNAFLQEHLTGMQIIHINNREEEELNRFNVINHSLRKANLKSVLYYSVFYPVIEIISALGIAILVWYGASNVISGRVSQGELVAFVMYVQMFFRPIRMLADQFNILQLGMVSAERIFKVLDTEEFISNTGKDSFELQENQRGIGIEFKEVTFAYNEPEWVLQDINLNIKPGEKVALVGSTGSGKSTIINLLSRFYPLQKGEILIDEVPIKSLSLDELRSLIGVVLQDVFLFSGSVYENITLNNTDIPLERVIEAAKQVGAHNFIEQLPGAYDYKVRERGATLSLGQRQLIAFARVMTYDPHILVLDEATANIDTESEEIIQKAVETLMQGRTSIVIAHRLSTIQEADMIVVLDKGRIIEKGSHKELLKLGGAYHNLHQKQFVSV